MSVGKPQNVRNILASCQNVYLLLINMWLMTDCMEFNVLIGYSKGLQDYVYEKRNLFFTQIKGHYFVDLTISKNMNLTIPQNRKS